MYLLDSIVYTFVTNGYKNTYYWPVQTVLQGKLWVISFLDDENLLFFQI